MTCMSGPLLRACARCPRTLVTDDMSIGEGASIQTRVNEVLFHNYNVSHATLQLECDDCVPISYIALLEKSHISMSGS